MFTKEKIKPENSLLQPHKESTLEKNQRLRIERREKINAEMNKIVKDKF
tara:strand:- start:1988 stop:2134 length:147 start_codon:yes stop_codon:yes gene_type:complete